MSRVVLREYDGRIIDLQDPSGLETMMDLCAEAERLARVLGWPVDPVATAAGDTDAGRHSTDAPTQVIPVYPGVPRATGLVGMYARAAAMQAAARTQEAESGSDFFQGQHLPGADARRRAGARQESAAPLPDRAELRPAGNDRIQVPVPPMPPAGAMAAMVAGYHQVPTIAELVNADRGSEISESGRRAAREANAAKDRLLADDH